MADLKSSSLDGVSDIENLELCKIPAPQEIKKGGILCFTRSFFFWVGGWGR